MLPLLPNRATRQLVDVGLPAWNGRCPGTQKPRNHTPPRGEGISVEGHPKKSKPRNHMGSERKHPRRRPSSSQGRPSPADQEFRSLSPAPLLHFLPSLIAS